MNRFLKSLGILALTLVMLGTAQAVPLSTLLNGGAITAGDKLFDQWELINVQTPSGSYLGWTGSDNALQPDYALIEVTPLDNGGDDPGPGINIDFGTQMTVTGDGIYAFSDLTFGFRVSTIGDKKIKDNSLYLTEYGLGQGVDLTSVFIEEKVYADAARTQLLGTKEVGDDPILGPRLSDSATFNPVSQVWVTKNILLEAFDPADTVTLISVEQRFSQTTIPEPGTLGLLALGCAGLICLGRKRRKC